MPNELYPDNPTVDPKIRAAIMEEDEPLTEADLAKIRQRSMEDATPMLTMRAGTKRVACTQCHKRPLKIARLCRDCYDERIRIADWKANVNIVRRGKGKPDLTCPWCGHTKRGWAEELSNPCCDKMRMALWDIRREEEAYERAHERFEIPDGL
jgi:hypothetical protein